MPLSDARKKANKKWNDANLKEKYDRIQLVVAKGQKEVIQAAAQAAGESVNAYIYAAIVQRMEREQTHGAGGFGFSPVEDNSIMCSRSTTPTPSPETAKEETASIDLATVPAADIARRLSAMEESEREIAIMGTPEQQEKTRQAMDAHREWVAKKKGKQ